MAFWDELKEMITQGSQEAIRKTKDIAEVMQTNADISESKRKINELYTEIGQMLVEDAFAGTTSEGLAAVLSDETADDGAREIVLRNWKEYYAKVRFIRSEEEVIALGEKKIAELRAEEKCPGCGARISKGAAYCPECGTRLIRPATANEEAQNTAQPSAEKNVQPSAEENVKYGEHAAAPEDVQSDKE